MSFVPLNNQTNLIPTMYFQNPFYLNRINSVAQTPRNLYNKFQNKKIKPFIEREGDWTCKNCKNLNFAFRKECNRCKFPKNKIGEKFEKNK